MKSRLILHNANAGIQINDQIEFSAASATIEKASPVDKTIVAAIGDTVALTIDSGDSIDIAEVIDAVQVPVDVTFAFDFSEAIVDGPNEPTVKAITVYKDVARTAEFAEGGDNAAWSALEANFEEVCLINGFETVHIADDYTTPANNLCNDVAGTVVRVKSDASSSPLSG